MKLTTKTNRHRTILWIGVLIFLIAYFYSDLRTGKEVIESALIKGELIADGKAKLQSPWTKIELEPVASGFELPTYLTHAGDGSGRIFVVEKPGRIRIVKDGKILDVPFLDIVSRVRSFESERGLLSAAFHPRYRDNGRFFVNYTDLNGDTVVAEYKVGKSPDKGDENSERKIIKIEQPRANHNGGQIEFGPEGYLYIGMGDGGGGGDPWGNAQNKMELLGKMLRIDVDGKNPYGIPKGNPLVGEKDALPEIWAYGLRNPWRFSFDSETGDMYIGDVGQNAWEEINFQPGKSNGGENYGWDLMEGFHAFEMPEGYDTSTLTMPIAEYGRSLGCSVTGGYVYRGKEFPSLSGTYLFSDFCSGRIWGLRKKSENVWQWTQLLASSLQISSFGEDEKGELYVVDYDRGGVYQITSEQE